VVWALSEAARAASEAVPSTQFPYDGGGPWNAAQCATALPAHVVRLIALLRRTFPWIRTVGTIRCSPLNVRQRDGTIRQDMSIHAVGRALDIMTPTLEAPEGEGLANWLVEHAKELGIQLVIWNRKVWQGSVPVAHRFQNYTGRKPHIDHVHAEVTLAAGPRLQPETPMQVLSAEMLAAVREVLHPMPAPTTPSQAMSTAFELPRWMGIGAVIGAGATAAWALATKRPGTPAPLVPGAIVGAVVGALGALAQTRPAQASARRVVRY